MYGHKTHKKVVLGTEGYILLRDKGTFILVAEEYTVVLEREVYIQFKNKGTCI